MLSSRHVMPGRSHGQTTTFCFSLNMLGGSLNRLVFHYNVELKHISVMLAWDPADECKPDRGAVPTLLIDAIC